MDLVSILSAAIGVGLLILVGIPVISAIAVFLLGVLFLTVTIVGAMILYVVGIPLSIAHRVRTGYWP